MKVQEMAQPLKEFATGPDNLTSVPRTIEWEEENQLSQLSSDLYTCTVVQSICSNLSKHGCAPLPIGRVLAPSTVPRERRSSPFSPWQGQVGAAVRQQLWIET